MVDVSLGEAPRRDDRPVREPIAIVGIGCRYPGGAYGPDGFWKMLTEGIDAISEVPRDRFDIDAVYDPRPGAPGKIITREGGFIPDVDKFAASFFGVSPREAARIDPQQRVVLEVAWEALEDAGQVPARLAKTRTGVFMGLCYTDYEDVSMGDGSDLDIYAFVGISPSILSGRLSYALNLDGPSVTVDTACSSSLVAVHLACESMWNGEATMALAGGANLILQPKYTIGFSRANMLAPDSRCKFGDARADGFVRSDGVGVVVLKPLSRAQADGDPIYAVIRGSAVNNDARSSGLLMTPSQEGQQAVVEEAYRLAGISPSRVQYVEAHGTGTSVGDPVELKALGRVVGPGRPDDRPLIVGSVKTNIGHTEGAAGVAGLIKAALALKHGVIPRSLHFQDPNPDIPWSELPVRVQQELTEWPDYGGPRLAGVNSFGIGGTNAHVVLESAPPISSESSTRTAGPHVLALSGDSPDALQAVAQNYREYLASDSAPEIGDLCYTATVRRTHHDHRLALVGESAAGLVEQLAAYLNGEMLRGVTAGRSIPGKQHRVVFVFPGQGSQWVGMGRSLMQHNPTFRAAIERCDVAMRPYVDWSLVDVIEGRGESSQLTEIDVIQPALFAVSVALAEVWKAWGVEPAAVVGHSMGEVGAAHVAGALSLDDAARIICCRSQLLRRISGKGAMASIELSLVDTERRIAGYEDRVSIAVSNSPTSTVISGDPDAVAEIIATLESEAIFCRPVKVDVASHSPQVDILRDDLLGALASLQPRPPQVPMHSTVTASVVGDEPLDADYWVQNLRRPVRLAAVTEGLVETGHDIFLEMSPNPLLLAAIQQTARGKGEDVTGVPSLRRDEDEQSALLTSLGSLYTVGYPVDWQRIYPEGQCAPLPMYPWQRDRFWTVARNRAGGQSSGHPLLGRAMRNAAQPNTHFWEVELDLESYPFLMDHRVQGAAVLPAAAFVEMAVAAAIEVRGDQAQKLEDITFEKALFLPEEGARTLQIVLTHETAESATVQFLSAAAGSEAEKPEWMVHARARVRTATDLEQGDRESLDDIRARCVETVDSATHYRLMAERGLNYGPAFQGIEEIGRSSGEALARVHLPDAVKFDTSRYYVHPTLLDACFQATLETLDMGGGTSGAYLPVAIGTVRFHRRSEGPLFGYARAVPSDGSEHIADVAVLDAEGHLVMEARGFKAQRLDGQAAQEHVEDWLYELRWEPETLSGGASTPADLGRWLILADDGGIGETLAERVRAAGGRSVVAVQGDWYAQLAPERFSVDPSDPAGLDRLLAGVLTSGDDPIRGIVHLWSVDDDPGDDLAGGDLVDAQYRGSISVLQLVQGLARIGSRPVPQLWLITRGAQVVDGVDAEAVLSQAPVQGVGRVLVNEHPELHCKRVDLGLTTNAYEIEQLIAEMRAETPEGEIALRGIDRYVRRLERYAPEAREAGPDLIETLVPDGADQPYRLETTRPGVLDNLILRATGRQAPGPGQVEVRVYASGLNFRDVLSAMGMLTGYPDGLGPMGCEFAGVIAAIGEGVEGFQIGDEVVGSGYNTFSAYVTTNAQLVMPKPTHLSFEEAASLPIAYLTAYYSLFYLGRITKGERVLIHAAAGGVGIAAVQLCHLIGAEVFATASSPEKHAYLRSIGVEHIMNSRTLDFAEEVLELTAGRGVDLVLNSLAGEFIPRSMATLAPCGRFLEIGKKDIDQNSQLDLLPFQNNLSYFAINIDKLFRERPEFLGAMFHEVMKLVQDSQLKPIPVTTFHVSQAAEAFRYMAGARHIGKIVISLRGGDVRVVDMPRAETTFRVDGTYLITGGLGGLGLTVAGWMVDRGARHLVLVGRRGLMPENEPAVRLMRNVGARVIVAQCDITDSADVAALLQQIEDELPPLRGVIHAAAVLDDGIVIQQTPERFESVMAPKVLGSWNLHRQTRELPLDSFVLFSSGATLFGSPGQANYVAGNLFMDTLAQLRRAQGLPALAINWGPWSEVGLAARPDRGGRLALRGMDSIAPLDGLNALDLLLEESAPQIGVLRVDWNRWRDYYPALVDSPFLQHVMAATEAGAQGSQAHPLREQVLAAAGEERRALVEAQITTQVARVLGLSASRLDVLQPLMKMGLDSLMAVEVKNLVENDFGVDVPVTLLLQDASVAQLANHVLAGLSSATAELPRIQGEQGPVTGRVPLTPRQQQFFEVDRRRPDHSAPPRLFQAQERLDPALLERVIEVLMRHHDALRMRFTRVDGEWQQFNAEHETNPIFDYVDLSGLPVQEQMVTMRGAVLELREQINLAEGPLIRVRAFDTSPDEPTWLLVMAHHLIFDGLSARILLEDLGTVYTQLKEGKEPALPLKTMSFKAWSEQLEQYARSPQAEVELDYWRRLTDVKLGPLPRRTGSGAPARHAKSVGAALSAEETTLLLRERLPAAGISVNDALLAALSFAFSTWTGDSSMLVNVSLHGRDPFMPGVDVSRTVGWFISVFPVVLDTAGALDMTELASRITRQLDAVPNRGIGFGALRYLHPDPGVREIMQQVPRPVVSFNYQGEMDRLPSRSILVDETSNWTQRIGEDQVWGAQVRVLAHVAQGQLQVSIGFNDGLYDARALECVASAFVAALRSLLDQDVNELEGAG